MKVGSRWLARKVLWRYALVNILTEANVTEGDSNDWIFCYCVGAGRTNSSSLRHLLLCHLFVSNFVVNRKGLFRPVPICDGAFLSSNVPTQNQQQLAEGNHGPVSKDLLFSNWLLMYPAGNYCDSDNSVTTLRVSCSLINLDVYLIFSPGLKWRDGASKPWAGNLLPLDIKVGTQVWKVTITVN